MQKLGYIISGTCGGFNEDFIRYSNGVEKDKISLADIRNNDDKNTKGKQCYAVSLQSAYNVISKIEIIKDGFRSKSTGFVSFNLIIPSGFYIDEESIISILDEGLGIYTDEFVKDNVLEDERLASNFDKEIEQLLSKVNLIPRENYKWEIGKKNAAYLFVPSDKISEYFKYENIFQEDYKDFREIYFIDPSEKGNPSTILNALKHDPNGDLTGLIGDLDNPDYSIVLEIEEGTTFNDNDITEEVKIKLNDNTSFKFIKNYYKTEKPNYSGKWKELLEKYPNVVFKSQELPNTIVIKSPEFEPEVKEIKLIFKCNGKEVAPQVLDYNIFSDDKQNTRIHDKKIHDKKIKLKGEDFAKNWEIKIASNKTYKSHQKTIYRQGHQLQQKISINLEEKELPVSKKLAQFVQRNSDAFLKMTMVLVLLLFLSSLGYLGYRFWPFGEEEVIAVKTPEKSEENTEEIVEESKEETITDIDTSNHVDTVTADTSEQKETELIVEKAPGTSEEIGNDSQDKKIDLETLEVQEGSQEEAEEAKSEKYSDEAFIKAFQNRDVIEGSLTKTQETIYHDYYQKIEGNNVLKELEISDLNELKIQIKKILN